MDALIENEAMFSRLNFFSQNEITTVHIKLWHANCSVMATANRKLICCLHKKAF